MYVAPSAATVRSHQRALNAFTSKHLRGVGPIKVDGENGPATRKRISQCKYWLGFGKRGTAWTEQLGKALAHPRDPRITSKGTVARGAARRQAHSAHHAASYLHPGVATWRGVRVAACAVPILDWCAANGWPGHVASGWRDPLYSRSLCRAMCGADSCPGRCAGLGSNHVGASPARFALDVTDYQTFARVVARCPLQPHIHNALGAQDPVHFSPSGR